MRLRHRQDRGATAVEYGLMLAAIAAVIIGLVFGIGSTMQGMFQETKNCMQARIDGNPPCPP